MIYVIYNKSTLCLSVWSDLQALQKVQDVLGHALCSSATGIDYHGGDCPDSRNSPLPAVTLVGFHLLWGLALFHLAVLQLCDHDHDRLWRLRAHFWGQSGETRSWNPFKNKSIIHIHIIKIDFPYSLESLAAGLWSIRSLWSCGLSSPWATWSWSWHL